MNYDTLIENAIQFLGNAIALGIIWGAILAVFLIVIDSFKHND